MQMAVDAAADAAAANAAAQLANDKVMNFIEEHEEDFVGFNLRISTAEEKINFRRNSGADLLHFFAIEFSGELLYLLFEFQSEEGRLDRAAGQF